MLNPKISFIPEVVCAQEYARVVPYLKDTLMAEPKHVNVGTIGHVDHSRSGISACISGALGTLPKTTTLWDVVSVKPQQPLNAMNASMLELVEDAVLNGRDVYVAHVQPKV
ncbi:hypothetical protein pEaSNUABM42_00204 [Erwinia phage pEa_SNUABM_42]|nr:hypothetical protein pEaSNUABM43_00205 [Erwinia phage pEa_SNUABM_43]QVW55521.1 hypothetical protein pEaSNUABM42_00204 [Erwinia phage pEa_SNUABM_42]